MMRKIGILFIINILTVVTLVAKPIILTEALQKKWVKVAVVKSEPNASQQEGKNLSLQMENLSTSGLSVIIPAGFIFSPEDSSDQRFINYQTQTIQLALRGQSTVELFASCIDAHKSSPFTGEKFNPSEMATGSLLKIVAFKDAHPSVSHYDMQTALWSTQDSSYLSGIKNDSLLTFTAKTLGKMKPDYRTRYRFNNEGGLIAAQTLEPLDIRGQFLYTLPEDMLVTLDLVNAEGKSVIERMNLKPIAQTQGKHRFTFHFGLKGVAHGTYFVTMTAQKDKKEWGRKSVVF